MSLRLIPHLHRATHQVGLYIDRRRDQLAVSQAEAHVLAHLSQVGSCSIAALHRSFGHKRSTLTSILNRLEERGLILREIHPQDRRSYLLRLTRTGRPLANKVRRELEHMEAAVFAHLSEPQIQVFLLALRAIGAAAEKK